jgi:ParB family chromosome partitioning protein
MKGQLGKLLNSRIGISMNEKGKGKIVIPFKSGEDLERIVKIIETQNKAT